MGAYTAVDMCSNPPHTVEEEQQESQTGKEADIIFSDSPTLAYGASSKYRTLRDIKDSNHII